MKFERGRVYRLKEGRSSDGGWLWICEGQAGVTVESYTFASVATGYRVTTVRPRYWFEEADDEV